MVTLDVHIVMKKTANYSCACALKYKCWWQKFGFKYEIVIITFICCVMFYFPLILQGNFINFGSVIMNVKDYLRVPIILLFLALFCFLISQNFISRIKSVDYTNYSEQENMDTEMLISKEEAINDFYYLCNTLESNYTYIKTAERLYNFEYKKIKAEFIELLNNKPEHINVKKFYYYVRDNYISYFRGSGHLSVLNAGEYFNLINIYNHQLKNDNSIHSKYLINVLNDSKPNLTYNYFNKLPNDVSISNKNQTSTLEFKYIDDNIAYIKIPSFSVELIDNDKEKLLSFYESLTEFEFLILDIRGNKGGNDYYWKENIVSPLIDESLICTQTFFARDTDLSRSYLQGFTLNKINDEDLHKYAKINNDDITDSDLITSGQVIVEPKYPNINKKLKIYLLVDEKVYSSAESFTMFCKQTDFATIVGTNTDGDGGGIDPILFTLPNSGLIVRFSILYKINSDGSCNEEFGTTPDYIYNDNNLLLDWVIDNITYLQ